MVFHLFLVKAHLLMRAIIFLNGIICLLTIENRQTLINIEYMLKYLNTFIFFKFYIQKLNIQGIYKKQNKKNPKQINMFWYRDMFYKIENILREKHGNSIFCIVFLFS